MGILITPEWPYCAYPLVFEPYNFCYHDCVYCFTKHKESWHNKASKRKLRGFSEKLDVASLKSFENYFDRKVPKNKEDKLVKYFMDQKYAIQVGAQTDPGGGLEKKYEVTLRLLKLLKTKGNCYPVRISTKGVVFMSEAYYEVLRDYERATILISINSLDEEIVKKIEPGAPSVKKRLSMAKKLYKTKAKLGLRLRPIIPYFTEKTIEDLIRLARKNGFGWVTVEWLRIPRTLTKKSYDNYEKLSSIINFDLIDYYKTHSDINDNRNGYLRLKPRHTIAMYNKISLLCKKYNLPLASCNKDFRCYNTYSPNCCGLPLSDGSWSRMQLSYAVYVAKTNGKVRLEDIFDSDSPLNKVKNKDNGSHQYYNLTYAETLKEIWNDPGHRFYPAKFFCELETDSIDTNGNHVFSYSERSD